MQSDCNMTEKILSTKIFLLLYLFLRVQKKQKSRGLTLLLTTRLIELLTAFQFPFEACQISFRTGTECYHRYLLRSFG